MNALHPSEQLYILIRKDIANIIGDRIPSYNFEAIRMTNALPVGTQHWQVSISFKIKGNPNIQNLTAVKEHLKDVGEALVVDYNELLNLQGKIERVYLKPAPFKQEKASFQRL